MPVIKLSDEEATLFFTDQFNQNNPIQILSPELYQAQLLSTALYLKSQRNVSYQAVPLNVMVSFTYVNSRLNQSFNVDLYLCLLMHYRYYGKSQGQCVSSQFVHEDVIFSKMDVTELGTETPYTIKTKNKTACVNYSSLPPSDIQTDRLERFLSRHPDISNNLVYLFDLQKLSTQLHIDIHAKVNQHLAELA